MSSTIEAYPRLMAALNEVRGQWRLHKILEGALLTLAGTLGVLILLVAADNILHPGPIGRVLLAGILWGGLILSIFSLIVKRILEDRRDDFFAALVERKHPEMHNTLINALQLGRDHTRGVSRTLIDAIIHDADRMLVDSEMGDAVDRKPTKRAAIFAVVGLLLVAGYAGAMTPRFFNGLAQVLFPISDIEPYTRTKIPDKNVKPGASKVAEGRPVEMSVKVEGVIPSSARVHRRVKGGSGSWQVNEMTADSNNEGVFRFTVPQAGSSFDYFITAGDARSSTFPIDVIKPPQIAKLAIVYTYPAYTGLSPKRNDSSDGEVSGIAGTTVKLELTPSKPLKEAKLVTRKDRKEIERELLLVKEGDHYTVEFVVWTPTAKATPDLEGKHLVAAPTSYQIKMEDTDGYPNIDPLWRSIALKADQVPELALRGPEDKSSVHSGDVKKLDVDARDDYGLALVRILYRVNNQEKRNELVRFEYEKAAPKLQTSDSYQWNLKSSGVKVGDRLEYWAEATDRNVITGPGKSESRHFTMEVINPLEVVAKLDIKVRDYVAELKKILALQRQNRAETAGGVVFKELVTREIEIRKRTTGLARAIESDHVPIHTVIEALDALAAGPMAEVVKLLESGDGSQKEELAAKFRGDSLPIQDKIIKELEELLVRLMRNEDAKKALRRMEKKDPAGHKLTTAVLADLIKSLDKLLKDQTETAGKFERLPKKDPDKIKEDMLKALNDLDDLKKRSEKWAKGTVQELTKLPKGFTDDFDMRKEVNKIYEEIEKAKEKAKAEKLEVSLEDLGAGLATKMKEDLEMWMPDAADNLKWVLEEPLNKKPMKIPEMPLPKSLQDLIGDLLQKADEFDEDADDITSAWGDNLDQAGWGVGDGPISTFSAKGKTGNDQPNNMELSGRSGDGRRGKSTGQMVGDTAKALPGRKTPARVGTENYEPGKLKAEGQEDPNGSTGGGKKTGAGRQGLQGGTPPDVVPDIGRLSAKQAGMREKMEQVAKKLEGKGVSTTRLREGIKLLETADKDLTDRRYVDAAKKRKDAMKRLRGAFSELDRSTATQINRPRDLPAQMRNELLQSAEAAYPAGYEALLKSYYKALSTAEK